MTKQKVAGYSPFGAPSRNNGLGPFKALYGEGVNLSKAKDLKGLDALILWGGEDISPSLYKEARWLNSGPTEPSKRDLFEWYLIQEAVRLKLPIIGICRGAQLACAYVGGKLVQHCDYHGTGHNITTYDGHMMRVTSAHHQMMYPYDVSHELLAWSQYPQSQQYLPAVEPHNLKLKNREVKEPEVVWFQDINCMAVQCHPEWHDVNDRFNNWLFDQIDFFCSVKEKTE